MFNIHTQLDAGQKVVRSGKNLTVVDRDGKVVAEFTIGAFGEIWPKEEVKSEPPTGYYKVTNLYVDPATGKLVVEYDNTPAK